MRDKKYLQNFEYSKEIDNLKDLWVVGIIFKWTHKHYNLKMDELFGC